MTTVEPQLWIERAGEAVDFYVEAFGAEVVHRVGEGEDIVARLEIDGARFWVARSDASLARNDPASIGGGTARMLLVVDDPQASFDRAVTAGATIESRPAEEHGWTVGRVTDPFGNEWEIGREG